MGLILIPEVLDRAQNGVRRRSSQGTEGSLSNYPSQFLQELNIPLLSPPLRNVIQYLVHPLGTFTTGGALPTGLIPEEVDEVLGDVHHAGVLVHDDHSP